MESSQTNHESAEIQKTAAKKRFEIHRLEERIAPKRGPNGCPWGQWKKGACYGQGYQYDPCYGGYCW